MTSDWELAAAKGDADSLATQLAAGVAVDALNRYGQTALMIAASKGHLEAVRLLVDAGAALDVTAKFGLSALMLAVIGKHEAVARTLAAVGADCGLVGTGAPGFDGKSASQLAFERGLEDLSRALDPGPPTV